MATRDTDRGDENPEDPADLLPETSVLTLEEYLDMQAAVGDRVRFEIVYRLVHGGDASPTELSDQVAVDDSTLHYHLNELVDVGLVERRKRIEPDSRGLYTYYRATVLGEVILDHGVEELLRRESTFRSAYDSTEPAE